MKSEKGDHVVEGKQRPGKLDGRLPARYFD